MGEEKQAVQIIVKDKESLRKMIDSIPVPYLGYPYKEFRKKLTLEKYGWLVK